MGMLERLAAELASMRDQLAEMNQRVSSVESGLPAQVAPLHVQLAPEAIEQIAAAVAGLSAAGVEALGEALAAGGDDLAASIATLVQGEIERTLAEAGLDVVVTSEIPEGLGESPVAEDQDVDTAVAEAPVANAPVVEVPVVETAEPVPEAPASPATAAAPVVSLADSVALNHAEPTSAGQRDGFGIVDEDDPDAFSDDADRPTLALSELDDPFLDALIRREPLSA